MKIRTNTSKKAMLVAAGVKYATASTNRAFGVTKGSSMPKIKNTTTNSKK